MGLLKTNSLDLMPSPSQKTQEENPSRGEDDGVPGSIYFPL